MNKTTLIAGSRHWERQEHIIVAQYVDRIVKSAISNGERIIVGDNPKGVDAMVVNSVIFYGYGTVYGVTPTPRYNPAKRLNYKVVGTGIANPRYGDYRRRDKHMMDQADLVVCIWNQKSRGTLSLFRDACNASKKASLLVFEQGAIKIKTECADEKSVPTQLNLFG